MKRPYFTLPERQMIYNCEDSTLVYHMLRQLERIKQLRNLERCLKGMTTGCFELSHNLNPFKKK
jgi:hypothetical protein